MQVRWIVVVEMLVGGSDGPGGTCWSVGQKKLFYSYFCDLFDFC